MSVSANDPTFWRGRATEARAVAAKMTDEFSRDTMLAVAARYERLANVFGATDLEQRRSAPLH
jgi:hypothetical protein